MSDRLKLKRKRLGNLTAKFLIVAAVTAVLLVSWARLPRTVTGTIPGHPWPGKVRLCSPERVLQTDVDSGGHFMFVDVPPGTYDLTAPQIWVNAEVRTGIGLTTVVAVKWWDRQYQKDRGWDCNPNPEPACPTDYKVEYGERRASGSGMILGFVQDGSPPGNRPRPRLQGCKLTLTNVRNQALHYSTISDRDGHFQFAPPAGVYTLSISRPGFFDVVSIGFLVPKENNTMVSIQTQSEATHYLCE